MTLLATDFRIFISFCSLVGHDKVWALRCFPWFGRWEIAIPDHFVVLVNTKYSRNFRNVEFVSGSLIAKKCVIRPSCKCSGRRPEKTGLPKNLHGFLYVEYDPSSFRPAVLSHSDNTPPIFTVMVPQLIGIEWN
jgi:hypothetical protein